MLSGDRAKMARISYAALFSLLLCFIVGRTAKAQVQSVGIRPELLRDVGIDQRLGNAVPLDLEFRDEHGAAVRFGRYFEGKPVILALVYYQCPMLCTEVTNGLLNTLKQVSLDAGTQFNVLVVSIDPHDTPVEADAKQLLYASLYERHGSAAGWHFLTGKDPQIHALAEAVGFRYAYDAASGQYAHASAIMILTPDGRVSRYFYGISYPPRDVRLGLVEASSNRIGSPVDEVLLYCYHYDPATGKYGIVISNVLRAAGLLTILVLGALIFALTRGTASPLPSKRA
jgi:protein SCO1/2